MLKLDLAVRPVNRPSLAEWATTTLAMPEARVQVRLRGNNLYLLCEGSPCPDVTVTVTRFARSLANQPIENLSPPNQPKIYQVFLSGRETGHNRPDWTVRLDPAQLERYLEPEKPAPPAQQANEPVKSRETKKQTAEKKIAPAAEFEALRSPQSQANQREARLGNPDAIARYVSESLSSLGVGIKVAVKDINPQTVGKDSPIVSKKRLWVWAESAYSPDPSLLGEPITQRLRKLLENRQGVCLEGFRDAVILGQVSGENRPEWILRVDLTPPEQILKAWGAWGDIQAIALLLERMLADLGVTVRAAIKESTLHLFCSYPTETGFREALADGTLVATGQSSIDSVPEKQACVAAIKPLLEELSPQGIHAATIYGVTPQQETEEEGSADAVSAPRWVDWVKLPASQHPALSESALELGKRGDIEALTFLLDRLIHPQIKAKLATGGANVSILQKGNLLHVITDAPIPPPQIRVGPPVVKFLRQLQIPGIEGVRVYGRRAGTKQPLWRYGADFAGRLATIPEPAPEFAPTERELTDYLPQPGDLVRHPDIKPKESTETPGLTRRLGEGIGWGLQQVLVGSQLFAPKNQLAAQATPHGMWIAIIWGTLGLLITVQSDWLLGHFLKTANIPRPAAGLRAGNSGGGQDGIADQPNALLPFNPRPANVALQLPEVSLQRAPSGEGDVFNSSGFTQGGTDITFSGKCQVSEGQVDPEKCILDPNSLPSFNSRQLDEQILRYQQYLAENGTPDILVVGSSRALRGIDPATLETALKQQGFANLKIFNFGINGATAQVVDGLIRQILKPSQLPRLIIWADGARAFNSGRVDVTYNGLTVSEGFKQLAAGKYPIKSPAGNDVVTENAGNVPGGVVEDLQKSWVSSYQEISESLNGKLASISASYPQRDLLQTVLTQQWANALNLGTGLTTKFSKTAPNQQTEATADVAPVGTSDANGFLRLAVRFNPASYYQKHPRVSGSYDGDYESFQLIGRQSAAFKNLREYANANNISLVFVNMPLTEDYLDTTRKNYESQFRQYMQNLAAEQSFVFRDLSLLWPLQNEYFSDPSHLNRYGAFEVSQRLAKDPLIPWPSSEKKSEGLPVSLTGN
ncbi:DUF1574 domain-containing protein [Ancylothrix sp. C2]|uniref:DUF1574 domain-containing protein n=1 Tax=Ancylothrix sp. D3o TaxID=2953691 RepID=UPI0021BB2EEC|nr:DUF1574 domain-containing protein [Ancylothrix sp. D3o]MCT7951552.1 DUF1574 domain-containing protein [Ancylothrix sp. D3o]